MERCSPVKMRNALEMVDALKKGGIEFVPIPVLNDDDYKILMALLNDKLTIIEKGV